ncbi:hypothetical protein ABGB12_28025 [Actinocorallia sp. B10E7]|uniref:hypothetical protein n=1 Tax=Actinocorallia sp. B10E7 TaxID=3153558 RepID=UPI00325D5DE8
MTITKPEGQGTTDSPADGPAMRAYAVGVVAGAFVGLLVGGVLGRLAMFVLRLTSPQASMGLTTDADSTIGEWSLKTFELLEVGIAMGAQVGALYMLVRPWLAERHRPAMTGVFGALIGGAMFIRTDGVDFYAVEPLYLTVPVFIVLPGLFGWLLAWTAERLMDGGFLAGEPTWKLWTPILLVLPAVIHISLLPPGIIMLVAAVLATVGRDRWRTPVRIWRSRVTSWIGTRLLSVFAVIELVRIVHAVNVIADHPGGLG